MLPATGSSLLSTYSRLCAYLLLPLFLILGTIPQLAIAQGVCDRSEQIKAAIVKTLQEVENCEKVTPEDLAGILYLNLSMSSISNLNTNDFEGLSNLIDLDLEDNKLRELESGQFRALQSVEIIRLSRNRLSRFPMGVFTDLPKLRILKLADNNLGTIPDDAFGNLRMVYELDVRGNTVSIRSDLILEKLPRLTSLGVDRDRIPHISPSIFSKVRFLQLNPTVSTVRVPGAYLTLQSGGASGTAVFIVRSSRKFAAHNQYPPDGFSAYAILAFPSSVTQDSTSRYKAICEGYLSTLVASGRLVANAIPESSQLVTIWPLEDAAMANDLNAWPIVRNHSCDDVVDNIDILMSQEAIGRAERHLDVDFTGDGPYLLAWSPGRNYDDPSDDLAVLALDLTNVLTSEQAKRAFGFWRDEIERDPAIWEKAWNLEAIKLKFVWFAERYGPPILNFIDRRFQ